MYEEKSKRGKYRTEIGKRTRNPEDKELRN